MRPPLQFASFVKDIASDPCQIPDVRVFVGFLGRSCRGTSSPVADAIAANAESLSETLMANAQARYAGMVAAAEAARNAVAGAVVANQVAADRAAAANAVAAAATDAVNAIPDDAAARKAGANVVAAAAHHIVGDAGALPTVGEAAERVASEAEAAAVPDDAILNAYDRLLTINKVRRERWLRLYFTLDLKEYVDVREADIVYNERTSSQLLQRQATILWVRSDAEIWHVRMHSHPVAATDFLRGRLAQSDQPVIRPVIARDIGVQEDPPSWGGAC